MELCIQTGGLLEHFSFDEFYRMIRDAGFTAIDWNIDHAWNDKLIRAGDLSGGCVFEKPLDEVLAYYSEELSYIRKYGLKISQAHAPFPPYVEGHPEIVDYAIRMYQRAIEFCDAVGCQNLVVHGISRKLNNLEDTQEYIDDLNLRLYTGLIPTLRKTNVTVCLEDLATGLTTTGMKCYCEGHCCDARDAAAIIDRLNEMAGKEAFGLCLDIGHLNLISVDPRIYIKTVGKRIKALHVHDNTSQEDNHLAPLTGTVSWNAFCSALHDIGYDHDMDFETFQQANRAYAVDPGLVFPWLCLIEKTGEVFRKKILG